MASDMFIHKDTGEEGEVKYKVLNLIQKADHLFLIKDTVVSVSSRHLDRKTKSMKIELLKPETWAFLAYVRYLFLSAQFYRIHSFFL